MRAFFVLLYNQRNILKTEKICFKQSNSIKEKNSCINQTKNL